MRGRRRGDRIHEGRGRVGGRKWPAMAAAASLDLSIPRVMRSYTWREAAWCPAAGSCVCACVSPRAVGGAARAGWAAAAGRPINHFVLLLRRCWLLGWWSCTPWCVPSGGMEIGSAPTATRRRTADGRIGIQIVSMSLRGSVCAATPGRELARASRDVLRALMALPASSAWR